MVIRHQSLAGDETTIEVLGAFDFSKQQDFRRAYEGDTFCHYTIDLAETSTMDTSALGMLLVMSDYLKENGMDAKIVNAHGKAKKLLDIARIDQFITVEDEFTKVSLMNYKQAM